MPLYTYVCTTRFVLHDIVRKQIINNSHTSNKANNSRACSHYHHNTTNTV